MRNVLRHVGRFALGAVLALLWVTPAEAQWADNARSQCLSVDNTTGAPDYCPPAAGFNLFGNADYAAVGFRMSGNFQFATTNEGPCERPANLSGSNGVVFCMYVNKPGRGFLFSWFQLGLISGVPPSEWRKIKKVAPEAANATGDGYAVMWGNLIGGLIIETGPADGTLGKLFSGVQSTSDGSCLDNSSFSLNGSMPAGIPVLASSDCPPSWPSSGFDGARNINIEGWQDYKAIAGPNFNWDYWRVPNQFIETKPVGSYSTYYVLSDYYKEQRARFGGAVPGGSGAPVIQGYPVGLEWRAEAWKFGLPSVQSTVFYRLTVVNKTADVWGTGIDYDSLYLGLTTGTGGSPQNYANYYEPWSGRGIFMQSGVNPNCNGAPVVTGATQGCTTGTNAGFGRGATGITMLKSPIGDLRNKQFSDPTSPFYDPSHPNAGDTITFNHGHQCGFGGCTAETFNVSDKRAFGMLASIENLVLDGRNPATIAARSYWRTFRSNNFPAQTGKFNKYVPGPGAVLAPGPTWDWNKDGVPDTLFLDSCDEDGCVTTFADTSPSGHVNGYGNIGGIFGVGPIKLKAGDTTAFWFSISGQSDSISLISELDAALDLYQTFFFGPEAPPATHIVSTTVRAASQADITDPSRLVGQNSSISIFFGEESERWVDPFLLKFADDMEAAPAGTPLGDLRDINAQQQRLIIRIDTVATTPVLITDTTFQTLPGRDLVAEIRAAAADNLAGLEIYKSCDGGANFTADGDCDGDPAVDERGTPIGVGWRAYSLIDRAPGADIPNVFTDNTVFPGKSHLYAILAKSRGLKLQVLTATGGLDTLVVAPQLANPLSRATSDVNVVSVYVPVGQQAGYRPPQLSITGTIGNVTVPVTVGFTRNVTAGGYRAAFGNRITVTTVRDAATGAVDSAWVLVEDTVKAAGPGNTPVSAVLRTAQYGTNDPTGIPFAGTPSSTATSGDTTVTVFRAVGFVLVNEAGQPFFATALLTGSAATPTGLFARNDFPGFTVGFDNRLEGTFATGSEQQLTAAGDTVNRTNVNLFYVQWQQGSSAARSGGRGAYTVTWTSDPFGLTRGLRLNLTNPAATAAELDAALRSRPLGTTGLTDAATAALVGTPQADLVPMRFPFTVRNTTFGRDVRIAVTSRLNNTMVLGSGNDTARVAIPPAEWVAGDVMFFIEDVTRDSVVVVGTDTLVVLDAGGQPIPVIRPEITFTAVLGCDARPQYNPATVAQPAPYVPTEAGAVTTFEYYNGATGRSEIAFALTAPVTGSAITSVTADDLARIRVVPNPFVVFSQYQTNITESRIMWAGVPPSGTLRVYTVSGQFVQQITWTQADLNETGDLAWNLRTREGTELASGLYLWVLTTDVGGATQNARGKFVVIRGTTR